MKLLAVCLLALGTAIASAQTSPWEKEIVYQIFERSFYDSNGDRIGDFNGIKQKLGYLKDLGVTAILLQPTFKARVYHNYFADSFWQVDPAFGTNKSFFDMVRAAHKRHIKVILDMEIQYVASLHPWYIAAKEHPGSPEAHRVMSMDGIFGMGAVYSYTGAKIPIATINSKDPAVLAESKKVFCYWAAPPDRPADGVDGFRLDHMMDDLDNKHQNVDMYQAFWTPIENAVRKIKPKTFFVAEQSDWAQIGTEQMTKGSVDSAYAIPLRAAFVSRFQGPSKGVKPYSPGDVQDAIEKTIKGTPAGKTQLLVIEDHDVQRYASLVHNNPRLLRLGAVFMLTMKGTPSIYYGQELGMRGTQLHGKTDGNDIPVRLAMRWTHSVKSLGTATWYGSGPWNSPANSSDYDGRSVEEQAHDARSILNFYRRMIRVRKANPALSGGSISLVRTSDPNVVAYLRSARGNAVLVLLNLNSVATKVRFEPERGDSHAYSFVGRRTVHLDGYGYKLIVIRRAS